MTADLTVQNEGSISLLRAASPAGETWIAEHIDADAMTWAGAIVVEHRFIDAIIEGATWDGLTVEDVLGDWRA